MLETSIVSELDSFFTSCQNEGRGGARSPFLCACPPPPPIIKLNGCSPSLKKEV